jgi:hypothetical protein
MEHPLPLPRQRLHLPPLHPDLPARPGHLVVRPAGDAQRCLPVMGEAGLREPPGQLVQLASVPIVPAPEVDDGGQAVALAGVAGGVGEDEVVAQVEERRRRRPLRPLAPLPLLHGHGKRRSSPFLMRRCVVRHLPPAPEPLEQELQSGRSRRSWAIRSHMACRSVAPFFGPLDVFLAREEPIPVGLGHREVSVHCCVSIRH